MQSVLQVHGQLFQETQSLSIVWRSIENRLTMLDVLDSACLHRSCADRRTALTDTGRRTRSAEPAGPTTSARPRAGPAFLSPAPAPQPRQPRPAASPLPAPVGPPLHATRPAPRPRSAGAPQLASLPHLDPNHRAECGHRLAPSVPRLKLTRETPPRHRPAPGGPASAPLRP